jgi:hypothetical protein
MVIRTCKFCNYSTPSKFNFEKHLLTKKHLHNISEKGQFEHQNEENEEENEDPVLPNEDKSSVFNTDEKQNESLLFSKSPQYICHFCQKNFSRNDNLKRHISVCKLTQIGLGHQKAPKSTEILDSKSPIKCPYCQQTFSRQYTLNRHYGRCKILKIHKTKEKDVAEIKKEMEIELLKKDLEKEKALNQLKDKTIEIASQSRQTINNKTINFLNAKFGDMITMEQFLYNLQHHEQLTYQERDSLLASFKEKGMELFARNFSYIMKQNCQRQLLKEGLPPHQLLPLYCSDGNLRSHKEKEPEGWKTSYDNQSINRMINISSTQVYESHRQPIPIVRRDRNKIFKQIKQDNHANNEELQKLMDNSED